MNRRYNANVSPEIVVDMEGWTGAEIEKFVIASLYDGAEEAFRNIKPIYKQNKEKIEKARDWAKANCRMANSEEAAQPAAKRKLRKEA